MISTFFLLLLGAGGAHDKGAAEGPDSVLVRYDLGGLLASFDSSTFVESLLMSGGSPGDAVQRSSSEDMYERVDAESLVELLARLFNEEFEYEGRELALQDADELLVLAPPEVQEKVQGALTALEQALSSSVELQVDVVALPGEGPPPFGGACVIDAAQAANLPSSPDRPRETYTVRLSPGRTSVVDRRRMIPVVVDYDVEIAQGALIHDPVVGTAETGTRLLVRGVPMADGLALSIFYAHGDPVREDVQEIEAPLRGFVSSENGTEDRFIEGPRAEERVEIAFRSAAFNTFLPAGKALVLTSTLDLSTSQPEGAGRSRQAVIVRRVSGELPRFRRYSSPGTKRELLFVNAETLHGPEMKSWGRLIGGGEESMEHIPEVRGQLEPESSVFLMDWISDRFSTWRTVGPWVICAYDPTWDESAGAELERLTQGWHAETRLSEVELHARVRGVDAAAWKLPVRVGSQAAGMVGISSTSLVDYDVEVAQFAAGADPKFFPYFSGLVFRGAASANEAGETRLDLEAIAHLRREAPRMVTLGGPYMTRLEKTTFDVLRVWDRVSGTASLGDRGEQGGALSLDVALK